MVAGMAKILFLKSIARQRAKISSLERINRFGRAVKCQVFSSVTGR
ncbi:hypothetical protein EZJ58_1260 [Sodalis ligni]|uniref:Uncharacterized protein n=1 Tax=Sodalis ligni TaxID=2697027 RepID=A0A4R1N7P1_9GAMM|nr:hypothetical protein EZJ58_1260 [Sodalis ligni]